jgi:signal peptidase I
MIIATLTGTIRVMAPGVLPVQIVVVSGPSMVPTLHDGDRLLVWRGARVRPGDVVLARFASLPELLVVKRAVRPVGPGWQLASDNDFAGGDSRRYGPGEVLGRVLLRLPRGSLCARRLTKPD